MANLKTFADFVGSFGQIGALWRMHCLSLPKLTYNHARLGQGQGYENKVRDEAMG